MSTKKITKDMFQEIVNRMMKAFSVANEYEVADIIGMAKDTFANRKSRGSLPVEKIKLACFEKGISFDWVMTGEGEMRIILVGESLAGYAASKVHHALNPEDEKMLEILKSMPRAREAMEAFLALSERKQKIHLGKMLESLEEMGGEEKK